MQSSTKDNSHSHKTSAGTTMRNGSVSGNGGAISRRPTTTSNALIVPVQKKKNPPLVSIECSSEYNCTYIR